MAHQRKVIRDAVQALLLNHTAAGARVFVEDRRRVRSGSELPALIVYSLSEKSDHNGTAPRELERDFDLAIEVWAAETATVTAADARDALALEVETIMHADPFFGEDAGDSFLSGTELDVDIDGDRNVGLAILTYTVTYRTLAPEAPTLDDFVTADTRHRIVGITDPTGTQDGHDVIVVQEIP